MYIKAMDSLTAKRIAVGMNVTGLSRKSIKTDVPCHSRFGMQRTLTTEWLQALIIVNKIEALNR